MRRANGEGSIYVEKGRDGFMAAITDPSGKRIKKHFNTRDEASAWIASIRAEIYTGQYIQPSNITIGLWCMDYLKTYCKPRIRPKTLESYKSLALHLAPIANIPLQKLTAPMVQKFYNNLSGLASSTKRQIHVFLSMLIKKAVALDMIKKNIMVAVDAPKSSKKEIQIFTIDELNKILDTAKNHKIHRKYYPIIYLAAVTGARLGEILALKFKNVHNGYIDIKETLQISDGKQVPMPPKTPAGLRRITIPADAQHLILAGKLRSFEGYVFCTKLGSPYYHSSVERVWRKILKLAGIPYRKFHVLRHTHATQLLAAGIPIMEVSKRLGHSNPSQTLTMYGHAIPGYDDSIPKKINEIMGSNMGAIGP